MVYRRSNDRRIHLFLNSLSAFNTCIEKNYTGFLIVVVPKSPLTISANLKKMFSEFFRELSTLHTCRLPITHDKSNLKGKSKKVRVIGSSKKTARSKQKTLLPYKHFNHIYL